MKTSIILVTYNNGFELLECIDACHSCDECHEIIIIDNGNSPEFRNQLNSHCEKLEKVKIIDAGFNMGFGRACNLGAKHAISDILIFLNPDAILKPDAIKQMLLTIDFNERSIVGGLICDDNGTEQRGARRGKLSVLSAMLSFSGIAKPGINRGFLRDFNQNREEMPKSPIEVGAISGAFFGIRKSDFENIGGFDEGFFLHVEDIDICARHIKNGGSVFFNPNAIAIHKGGASAASKFFVEWHKFKGFMRYFLKHETIIGKIISIFFAPLLFSALMGRIIVSRLLDFRHR